MSESLVPPPNASAPPPAEGSSLIERLRRITDLKSLPVLPEAPPAEPDHGPPPVDKLIPWLRDAFAAAAAVGIAVAVLAATGAIWLWLKACAGWALLRQKAAEWKAARAAKAPAPQTPPALPEPAAPVEAAGSFETAPAKLASAPPPVPAEPVAVLPPPAPELSAPPVPEAPEPPVTLPVEIIVAPAAPADDDIISPVASPAQPAPARRWPRIAALATVCVLVLCGFAYAVKPLRYWISGLLGKGNAAVVVGVDGWLFPRSAPAAEPVDVKAAVAALKADGAAVVIISVPAKEAVYPDRLEAAGGAQLQRSPSVTAALRECTVAGAQVIDLGPVLHGMKAADDAEGPVFAPQGSRWTPRGMAQAAFVAAERLQQEAGYAALPLQPALASVLPDKSRATMDDLVTLLQYGHVQQRYPARSWPVIRLVKPADKAPLSPDSSSAVVLLGGDAVRLYDDPALGQLPAGTPAGQPGSAGFAQHLAWHLSLPLDVFTVAGDGAAAAQEWLKSRPADSRRGRRFIVWVIEDAGLLR